MTIDQIFDMILELTNGDRMKNTYVVDQAFFSLEHLETMTKGIGATHICCEQSLGALLKETFDAFYKDEVIILKPLRKAILYMRANRMLTPLSYRILSAICHGGYRHISRYLGSGRFEYRYSMCFGSQEIEYEDSFSPIKAVDFLLRIFHDDELLKRKIGFLTYTYEELISRTNEILVGSIYDILEDYDFDEDSDLLEYGHCLFFFRRAKNPFTKALCFVNVHARNFEEDPAIQFMEGFSGEIRQCNGDLYFKYDMCSAYLHFRLLPPGMESYGIVNNIDIFGVDEENIVYLDTLTDVIYAQKRDKKTELCKYDGKYRYSVHSGYLLVSIHDRSEVLYHINYTDGSKSNSTPLERAREILDYIELFSTSLFCFTNEEKLEELEKKFSLRSSFTGQVLTLALLSNYIEVLANNHLFTRKVYPLRNIVKLLVRKGIDENIDISKIMFALIKYHHLCLWKRKTAFEPEFYYILYRLSKKDNFTELLINAPEELFKNVIRNDMPTDTPKSDEWDDPDNPFKVGVFDIIDGEISFISAPFRKGVVKNGILYFNTDEDPGKAQYRGMLCYAISQHEWLVSWPDNEDLEMLERLLKEIRISCGHYRRVFFKRNVNKDSFENTYGLLVPIWNGDDPGDQEDDFQYQDFVPDEENPD